MQRQQSIASERACSLPVIILGTALLQLMVILLFTAPSLSSLSLLLAISSSAVTVALGNTLGGGGTISFLSIVVVVLGSFSSLILFQTILHLFPLQLSVSLHFPLVQIITFVAGGRFWWWCATLLLTIDLYSGMLCVDWGSVSLATLVVSCIFACISAIASWRVVALNQ